MSIYLHFVFHHHASCSASTTPPTGSGGANCPYLQWWSTDWKFYEQPLNTWSNNWRNCEFRHGSRVLTSVHCVSLGNTRTLQLKQFNRALSSFIFRSSVKTIILLRNAKWRKLHIYCIPRDNVRNEKTHGLKLCSHWLSNIFLYCTEWAVFQIGLYVIVTWLTCFRSGFRFMCGGKAPEGTVPKLQIQN